MDHHMGEKWQECDMAWSREGLVDLSGTHWHF